MEQVRTFRWRPQTTLILLGGFTLILIAIVVSYIAANFKPTTSVQLGSGVFHLWVADTDDTRSKGLSGVEKLKMNGGLLMDFQTDDKWGIWMKDMQVPLDIIWLDKYKQVVHIERDVSPSLGSSKTFVPKKPSRYVIELPAGSVEKAGINTTQKALFSLGAET